MHTFHASALALLIGAVFSINALADDFKPVATYGVSHTASGWTITKDGVAFATVDNSGGTERLTVGKDELAELATTTSSVSYPRDVALKGQLVRMNAMPVEVSFTAVAPPAPIGIEEEDVGSSELADWLKSRAFAPKLKDFMSAFAKEVKGRRMHKWYEISGRVRDGVVKFDGKDVARFYSGYQVLQKGGAYKVHHRGDTLELAEIVTGPGQMSTPSNTFVSYRCGCHGYTEFSPKVALSGFDYRIELEANGGWFNWGYGDLFRKPLQFVLEDAKNKEYASIKFSYPDGRDFKNAVYRFIVEKTEIARVTVKGTSLRIDLNSSDGIDVLDTLLAMMPTQVVRGDGVRDSRLGELETAIDWIRLAQAPSTERLSDVMNATDAATTVSKVRNLLESNSERFKSRRDPRTPPPGVVCSDGKCQYVPGAGG